MKRPVVLIVSVVAGALLVAGAGASAHTVQLLTRAAGTHSALFGDEASGARTESPEPSESPEAAAAERAEKPKATKSPEAADNDNEAADNDTETGDDEGDHQHGAQHEDSGDKSDGGGSD